MPVDTGDQVRAWRPRVAGVSEVLHAAWRAHAYPGHTHDTWTLLLVDDGLIGYQLRAESSRLDQALVLGEDIEAESRLALVVERLAWHLTGRPDVAVGEPEMAVARRAREVLDDDPAGVRGIAAVAQTVGVSTAHLVRSFSRSYGIAPHQYLLGRRLDLARRRLLAGDALIDVAVATGFHDQSHLARHFKRLLAVTPGRYQRSAG